MLSWASGSIRARWKELIVGSIVSLSPLTTRTGLSTFVRPTGEVPCSQLHDYLKRSFLPGRVFWLPADFNGQLRDWLAAANARHRRSLGCRACNRLGADKAAMIPLPPVAPVTGWRRSARLPRDHYVRLDSNGYSVHPAVIGRRIEVTAGLVRVQVCRCSATGT